MLETSTEMGLALLWGGLVLPEFGGVTIVDENLRTIHRSRNQTAQGRQRSGLPEPDAGLRTELWFGCEIFSTILTPMYRLAFIIPSSANTRALEAVRDLDGKNV